MTKSAIITAFTAAIITGITLAGCDEVKESDRYIDMGEITAKRTVLLEEFTGQNCSNCPLAHEDVNNILTLYPDNVIAVSIHAGYQAVSEDANHPIVKPGLMTAEGNVYAGHWNVTVYPSGVVNRTSGVTGRNEWQGLVRSAIEKESIIDIEVEAALNAAGDKIEITTELSPGNNAAGKFQLWIVESGIVAPQLGLSGFTMDYVHNHVFRGSVNGTWGEDITLVTREPQTLTHEIALKDSWNASNLSVVAFVYNDTEGVLQAAECKLINQ